MDYIKDRDPKRLVRYLGSRLEDLRLRAEKERISLLPVRIAPAGGVTEAPPREVKGWKEAGRYHAVLPDGRSWWLEKSLVPPRLRENEVFALRLSFGRVTEGLLFVDGSVRGNFSASLDGDPGLVFLEGFCGGREMELMVHLYAGNRWGDMREFPPQVLDGFDLVRVSVTALDLYDAFSAAYGAALAMEENSPHRAAVVKALEAGYAGLDFSGGDAYYDSAARVLGFLEKEVFTGKDLLPARVFAFGHAHIDVAWLWPLGVTAEKCIRTFAGQLSLLDRHGGWQFQQGQPQLYEFVRDKAPGLYDRIKKAAADGRWRPEGAAWVEFDCNMTGGESVIRQIMYAKEYFREEFSADNRVAWLPDVFGFSASLPQILKKCGVDLFVTTKISWNESTRFPCDTFLWEGIDGTRVPAHFATAPAKEFHTYNTALKAEDISGTWNEYIQKDVNTDLIIPFGYGDGGGGPRDFMVRRLKWFRKGIRGFFRVSEGSLETFAEKLLGKDMSEFPVWAGELYLETHRGCLTTQAFCKKQNRRLEFLLERAEMISLFSSPPNEYPRTLEKAWKLLLLNQFHDILPGSSVREVYEDAREHYGWIESECSGVIKAAVERFIVPDEGFITLFNPFSWEYDGYARAEKAPLGEVSGTDSGRAVFEVSGLKPLEFRTIPAGKISRMEKSAPVSSRGKQGLENDFFRLEIDTESGTVTSLAMKKGGREFRGAGPGLNLLELYEDKPVRPGMGAWDLEYFHQHKKLPCRPVLTRKPVVADCSLFRKLVMDYGLSASRIRQEVILYRNDPLVYFRTRVDWSEEEAVLKAVFPVNINARSAAYDIQFGSIERPVHRNSPADHARFEAPGSRWVDLSEGYAGIALITDSKYGYGVHGSRISLTLLRSPVSPDGAADRGRHEFTYALYPHGGCWRRADVPRHACRLNYPLMIFYGRLDPRAMPIPAGECLRVEDETGDGENRGTNIILEAMKASRDGRGVIARFYECKNTGGRFRLRLNLPLARITGVFSCNMLEEEERELEFDRERGVRVDYRPFEIITLKFLAE